MKHLKIMVVCGFGLGTSLVLRMTLDEVLREHRINADTFCSDADTANGHNFDLVLTSNEISKIFKDQDKPMIIINNFLSTGEVQDKAIPVIHKLMKE